MTDVTDLTARLTQALAGRYAIEDELAAGGTARVYRAQDLKHQRLVAVKVLRPELAAVLGHERFLQEIETVARLNHPHILALHDSGDADGFLYYVMPVVEGESLRNRLNHEGRLPLAETVQLCHHIGSALDYAHRHRVVHRDIKPENILLHEGEAMITDFGIALALRQSGGSRITETGFSVGTPEYMSPEQVAGALQIDGRSDQYALACVTYEMLVGEPPFTASTAQQVLAMHVTDPPPSARSAHRGVPESVDGALRRALGKKPADRFASTGEFVSALEEAITTEVAIPSVPRSRRPGFRIGVAVAFAAIAALVGAAVVRSAPAIPFSERDWLLISDTDNSTGDAAFDQALVTALTVGLQQSPRINVVPGPRIADAMRRMGGGAIPDSLGGARLEGDLAREIALRENAKAVIVPAIERIDTVYVVAISAIDPATGDPLLSYSSRAYSRSDVITELDQLTRELRRDLGESMLSVARNTLALDRATTTSLEALQAYSEGRRADNNQRPDDALTLYLRAVELDSNFAMAHKGLAFHYYYYRNDRIRGDLHYQKALSLADRLTDLERLSIRADGSFAQGDFEKAATAYRIYTTRYPDDAGAWNNLGLSYMRLGMYDQAIATLHETIALDSTNASAFVNLATSFSAADHPDSALAYYDLTFERFPNLLVFANLNHEYGFTLVRAGANDSARAVFAKMFDGSRSDQARGHRSLALLDMYEGHYRESVARLREALILNRASDE